MATTKIGVEIDLDPSGVQRGADAAAKAVDGLANNTKGINKLDGALKDMGKSALNLPGPLGRLADAFTEFAPGGLAGAAFLGGIGASITILKSYSDAAKETEKINKNLAQTIADIEGRGAQFKLNNLNNELDQLGRKSRSAWQNFWYGSDGRLFGFGLSWDDQRKQLETEIRKTADTIKREIDAARSGMVAAASDVAMARAEAQGRGPQQRLEIARNQLALANQAYTTLQTNANATQEQLLEAQGKVFSAQAELIRAETALRDDAHAKRMKREDEFRQFQEFLAKQREDQEKRVQSVIQNGIKLLEDQARRRAEIQKTIADMVTSDLKKTIDQINAQLAKDAAQMEAAATRAAQIGAERLAAVEPLIFGISSGLDIMTKALVEGDNAFKAFGKGARAAITDILRALARQNIVEGLGALGKGFAAAANPLTAFAAGGFFKAASQHFAAAAAAGIGAAAIGAGGGGSSGVGRGIGPGGSFGFNQSQLGGVAGEQGSLFITIQGGTMLDMSNPETAKAFARALQTATNRRIVFSGA